MSAFLIFAVLFCELMTVVLTHLFKPFLNFFYINWVKIYAHWSRRLMHLCFRRSFDDVTRINFRFRLLVTWSSVHGRNASSHKIWCRYLYPMQSYWHFAEIKDGGRRRLGFVGGAMGPPTKAHSWCVLPVKISSYSDQ